jgi:hypothetical protein
MRDFVCPHCGQQLAFENSVCLNCGNAIGFDLAARDFAVLGEGGTTVLEPARKMCANLHVAACNWLVPVDGEPLCRSCSLRPRRPSVVWWWSWSSSACRSTTAPPTRRRV